MTSYSKTYLSKTLIYFQRTAGSRWSSCRTTHVREISTATSSRTNHPRRCLPSTHTSFRSTSSYHQLFQWKDFSTVREDKTSSLKQTPSFSSHRRQYLELDFFGEPVSFRVGKNNKVENPKKIIGNAAAALDGFLLAVVSKGKSCVGGGDEAGLDVKGAHSVALSWSELLKYAAVWNHHHHDETQTQQSQQQYAPMLVVAAVAPVLVQTGTAYVHHLDMLLRQAKPGVPGLPRIQMMTLAQQVVALLQYDEVVLDEREHLHLQALQYLLKDQHRAALVKYLHLLRQCPGDALALSLALDLCQTLGDKEAALRASGSVAAYWNERCGGYITPAIPGHSMASAWIALGFAVSGRHTDAEYMAERAMNKGRKVSGGVATWVQAHVFDAGGRIAEGISACANFDGIANYEGSAFLFFDCRLGGYGARFALDREERGRGKSAALRLYDRNFERVLEYSGFASGQAWQRPMQRAPLAWTEPKTLADSGETLEDDRTLMDKLLGKKKTKPKFEDYEIMIKGGHTPSTRVDGWKPSLEDVLTWLPPTPQLLSDATLLLLRFTLNGTISTKNYRWDDVRNGWRALLDIEVKHGSSTNISFCPLASVAASLLFPPSETGGDKVGNGRMAKALYRMGLSLKLGNPSTTKEKSKAVREVIADRDPNFWLPAEDEHSKEWEEIVKDFAAATDGYDLDGGVDDVEGNLQNGRFESWNFDARPLFEHAVCYAACKAGDLESLLLARAVCSQGVTLRTNSPEEWWRYSIVLGLLGDEVGSEDALNNSINFGGGQGARRA